MKPYPAYKDSGVEWLGEIPEAWSCQPIKRDFSVLLGKMLDGGRTPRPQDVELPYLRAANVQDSGLALDSVNRMAFAPDEERELDLREGDLLVVEGGAVGTSHVLKADLRGWSFQKTLNRVRPTAGRDSRFVSYVLRTYRDSGAIDVICNKSTIPHLTAEKLREIQLPTPLLVEQAAIAAYLDRETAQIDELIGEQEALIEALVERRDAAIFQGVSSVGAGRSTPLKFVARVSDCKHITAEFSDDGEFALASIGQIGERFVDLAMAKRTSRAFFDELIEGGREPKAGDLILTRNASVGAVSMVGLSMERFALGQDVCLISPIEAMLDRWLYYSLISSATKVQLAVQGVGTTFQRVNVETIKNFKVRKPSLAEQDKIATHLDEQTSRIDELMAECRELITLLKERRSALISAAVTGKIDVRTA